MAQYIKESSNPSDFIDIFIRACLRWRGSGLDIGMDTLMKAGEQTFKYAEEFYFRDCIRWAQSVEYLRHHKNDDVWYILLRSLGSSGYDREKVCYLCVACLGLTTPSVRDAAIRALGDLGDQESIKFVKNHMIYEKSQMVRETILEILEEYNEC